MKIFITGISGFVGSSLARFFKENVADVTVSGIDNFSRRGSEYNIERLKKLGCNVFHGDIRCREDIDELPPADWIIDCAAIPTVTTGITSGTLSLVNNNLTGTIFLLEKCRRENSGFIMLSTSRVYSINDLIKVPLSVGSDAFEVNGEGVFPRGFSSLGINEDFSTTAPVSLYGATKLASEVLALEYHHTFGFPVRINRCGVIAGPGQFGKIDQGIFSYWIYNWITNKPLSYIGFNGSGMQVRDFFSADDLGALLKCQIDDPGNSAPLVINAGGGIHSALSLKQLNEFCKTYFNVHKEISRKTVDRPFDIPYYVTDNTTAVKYWNWKPKAGKEALLEQIAKWGVKNKPLLESGF